MTSTEVREWIDREIPVILRSFGLPHWRVRIDYFRMDKEGDGFQPFMHVKRRVEYERAVICVDADICATDIDTEDELREFLEHEVMHIVHSPFNLVRDIVWEMLTEDQRGTLNETWRYAEELTLRNLERMAHGLRNEKDDST